MSNRKVIALSVLGLAVLSTSAFGVRVWSQAGQFTTVKNLRTNTCQIYSGIMAPEDIAIDRQKQTAFISSLDRASVKSQGASSSLRGSIQTLDLTSVQPGAAIRYTDITPDMPKQFRPRGLSLFTATDGSQRLFVINQADKNTQSVEIFRIASGALAYEKSVDLGPEVTFANDVLATGPDSFYVTDSATTGVVSWFLNFSLQRKRSKVFYFDGSKLAPAASDFVMANGIAMSKSGEQVYVLDTFARSLRFFKRNTKSGALADNGFLFIGSGVDNIDINEDGSLWMAAHPKLIDFALYSAGWRATSSSQVIHAVPGKKSGGEARTVFLDLGEKLSGSSVAVAYDNTFLIGSAMDNKLAVCAGK
jgi:arylesterase / paraoxonase